MKKSENTEPDWGSPGKPPLKRRLRRWGAIVVFILALHVLLNNLFAIPLVRHYVSIGSIIYDGTIGQVWREAARDKHRDLSLPNSPYKTYRSGYWLHNIASNGIYWLNDDEIVFDTDFRQGMDRPSMKTDIALWNYHKQAMVHRQMASLVCADGNGLYFFDNIERKYIHEVPAHNVYEQLPINNLQNRTDCTRILQEHPVIEQPVGAVRELRASDGWLEFDDEAIGKQRPNITWHKPGGTRIEVNLNKISVMHDLRITYYTYKNAYLLITGIRPDNRMWQTSDVRQLWWLYYDGKIEEISIPAPWGGFRNYAPTKRGIVFSGLHPKSKDGAFGVFLLDSSNVYELMANDVSANALSVSPSGCAIAFAATDKKNASFGREVFVVDLCIKQAESNDAR